MAVTITNMKPGQKHRLRFHGSKQFGNDPYELEMFKVSMTEDNQRAMLSETPDGADFEVYRHPSGRGWAYGTSAERVTVIS